MKEMKKMKKMLGQTKEGKFVCTSLNNSNQHICVTGGSGYGKSSEIHQMIIKCAESGDQTVVLNWHNTMNQSCIMPRIAQMYNRYVKVIDVAKEGIALPLFDRLSDDKGEKEAEHVMIQRLASMFRVSAELTGPQERILLEAIKDISEKKLYQEEGTSVIIDWLETQKKPAALNAASKIAPLCDGNVFRNGNFLKDSHRIIELDLNNLEYDVQDTVVRFLLDYMLRVANKGFFIDNGVNLFIDEAQNLDYRTGSTMYTLLNESRRLNLRLILALPSFITSKKRGMETITQCGTKLFFRPLEQELRKVAEIIDHGRDVDKWVFSLSRLKIGECIATGTFEVDGKIRTTPVLIKNQI